MEYDDYTMNAIKLSVLCSAQNWVMFEMKGNLNQKSKMLLNSSIRSSNKLMKYMEKDFDEQAEDACADLSSEILAIIEEIVKSKNAEGLIKLIKAYNNGEIQVIKSDGGAAEQV